MEKILNVGCGEDTYGTDFVDVYKSREEVVKCDINTERLPYNSNTFDEIYSRCVFEHLTNPLQVLEEMKRVLKPNGKLVVITDNAGFFGFHIPFNYTHYGGYEKNAKSEEDRHYLLFTPWHLKNFYRKANLKNIKSNYCFIEDSVRSKIIGKISKVLCFLIGIFWKRIAYPQIKIIGQK